MWVIALVQLKLIKGYCIGPAKNLKDAFLFIKTMIFSAIAWTPRRDLMKRGVPKPPTKGASDVCALTSDLTCIRLILVYHINTLLPHASYIPFISKNYI